VVLPFFFGMSRNSSWIIRLLVAGSRAPNSAATMSRNQSAAASWARGWPTTSYIRRRLKTLSARSRSVANSGRSGTRERPASRRASQSGQAVFQPGWAAASVIGG
jgi:hypothetical protein